MDTRHQNSIRLVNGSTVYQGRVEIYRNDTWGRICDSGWGMDDAYVACRQLGYGTAKNATGGTSFPPGGGLYWMDRVACDGEEESLAKCSFDGWGVISGCPLRDTAAGVVCQAYEPTDAVTIRLEGSSNSYEGRVQVFYSGAWGTICSDHWGLAEANVACGQLGFDGVQVATDAKTLFGADLTSPMYLSGLRCQGIETNLAQCARDSWLDDKCSSQDCDAGVVCISEDTPADGDLRLTGGSTASAGRLEIYHLGVWGTVCDDDWTENAATVACRELGYNGVEFALDHTDYGRHTGTIHLDNVHCTGRESRLTYCSHNGWGEHNCVHSEDVTLRCADESPDPAPPSTGTISLPMSSIIGIIIACSVIVSCALMIVRYLHYRQKISLTANRNNRVRALSRPDSANSFRYPIRGSSGLFLVNGMRVDPTLPPHGLEPPDYSSSPWKPPELPQEPPPSYEATVAHYPEARTDGVSSPVAPDYDATLLPNAVDFGQQPSPYQRRHGLGESVSSFEPTSTPPSSPMPPVD
ncbi:scavenger receptor cysteine-rich domain-containing group B protein-like isoform X2 [Acanthaster planci]|uniref:Scavenger receptor cysteine-rich domain-containing group B protein-like isoform X2 n=1 Tax=Acanthaster planci TaxID=133434 RepID=A0A8B7XN02_ACAPL|nr:scavenger receptor cysteine-rich domain-containing group B protein-like isoform X2 [Acanthaster planci]